MSNKPNKPKDTLPASPLEKIRLENITKAQTLGIALHPMAILQAHLTVLVEGLGFSYELEKEFAELLSAAESEMNRQKLVEGVAGVAPSKLTLA